MLRYWLLVAGITAGAPPPHVPPHQVRSTHTWVLDFLQEGYERSSTFRELLVDLEHTDAIVYVEPGICAFGHLMACLPNVVVATGGVRYLRVVFDPSRASGNRALALIGHELHHARDVARAPDVRTADDVIQLFRRLGFSPMCRRGIPDCFETVAARTTGDRIYDELAAVTPDR
jgi:hypothetical protein